MNNLVLKQADDKTFCLFWWNSQTKEMTKLAEGQICQNLDEYGYSILLGNNDDDFQVYQQRNYKLETIPVHCHNVRLISGVCMYERAGQWYCFVQGKEILLGQRYQQNLSFSYMIRMECSELFYFVLNGEKDKYILSFIYPFGLLRGNYQGNLRKNEEDYLLARREDGCYDIYSPDGLYVYDSEKKNSKRYFQDDENRVYFWDDENSGWRMVATNGFIWAENALQVNYSATSTQKAYSILFEVKGVTLEEKARGEWKVYNDGTFSVGGLVYSKDYEKNLVDFENPRRSFFKNIEAFLRG